ncbi:hypothetical protein SAMN02787142_3023 [Burkholderia sp. WP9]|uniref:hypothetical protein n=1 Tax=Burkholderia sp. WP9 TaxID=1500263 RepID=UPI000896A6B8|nr:hypothetical protein [Burkholderia sp. WP9]SED35365.1 hypothetical protein SAMN02787142_3023 [Burkholderia sp. WP9]
MILYQLCRPIAYLAIKHPEKKIADWYVPLFLASLGSIGALLAHGHINFFGAGGLVSSVLGFVQNLPGFYIAALAAIATFGRNDIDSVMPGNPPPRLETLTNSGVSNLISLTRRRFLCLLFAFLTVECVALTMLSIVAIAVAPTLSTWATKWPVVHLVAFLGVFFVYAILLSQLLVATLWGLYYLGDRIHQPDS